MHGCETRRDPGLPECSLSHRNVSQATGCKTPEVSSETLRKEYLSAALYEPNANLQRKRLTIARGNGGVDFISMASVRAPIGG